MIRARGKGGYVIAPGAVGDAGQYSRLSNPLKMAIEPPQWLLDLLKRPRPVVSNVVPFTGQAGTREHAYASATLGRLADELARTREGGRNQKLNEAAFAMGTMGTWIVEHDVVSELTNAALSAGLDLTEIENTIRSGFNAGLASPSCTPC